ncbi:type II secretion system F family protein [Herbaspirillum sp. HC18]|nr:type II secretion system F family protein [Herbaspirillum sp. HC18]
MDSLYLISVCAAFVVAALAIEGLFFLWQSKFGAQAQRVKRRLRTASHSAVPADSLLKKRMLSANPAVHALLIRLAPAVRVDRLIAQCGSRLNVARFFAQAVAVAGAVLAVLLILSVPAAFAAVLALASGVLPLAYLIRKKNLRLAAIEQQLPEALELIGRALRAGHALPIAIKIAAEKTLDPLGGELGTVFNEISYGVSMPDALKNLSERVPGSDVSFFAIAVVIQRETGGNLAVLLDTIARIIRERMMLQAQVKVYSAEGRLSAWILGLLPFALGAVLALINPFFMRVLWDDPVGIKMLLAALALMIAGVVWMRSVIRIRI